MDLDFYLEKTPFPSDQPKPRSQALTNFTFPFNTYPILEMKPFVAKILSQPRLTQQHTTKSQDINPKGSIPFNNNYKADEVSPEVPMGNIGTRFMKQGRGTLP